MEHVTAAIITVGSELVEGLRVDTNTAEIARALSAHSFHVVETLSVGDDPSVLADVMRRLIATHAIVVTTGGLGPTHDDITREAAAAALSTTLVRDPQLEALLAPIMLRHRDREAATQVLAQADVIPGAEVIRPTTGTAPGLVIATPSGSLVLLPGPPSEMRPMLAEALDRYPSHRGTPVDLGATGLSESDAQVLAQRALESFGGVSLTVLAKPGDVRVILIDDGAGQAAMDAAAPAVAAALGVACYTMAGKTLAEELVDVARSAAVSFSLAESCTGGLAAAEITAVPGASDVFAGSAVTYSNRAKTELLGVSSDTITLHGAVSADTARAMADGARARFGTPFAVAITGIAGPDGGSTDKPVGTVWFAVAGQHGTRAIEHRFSPSGRESIRQRSVACALDLLRREILET